MILRSLLRGFLPAAIGVAFCYAYLDRPLALWVFETLQGGMGRKAQPALPDLLLPIVVLVTGAGWTGRFVLARVPSHRDLQRALALLGVVAPSAYFLKEGLKFIFGRVETRAWLQNPALEGFHWFGGVDPYNGFPSGHMLVFVAIAAVLWRSHRRYRPLYALALSALGAALVLTDYHFLGDVIAGLYCGVLVERLVSLPQSLAFFRIPAGGSGPGR